MKKAMLFVLIAGVLAMGTRPKTHVIAMAGFKFDPAVMREKLTAGGLNALAFPSQYLKVEAIPKLGSGKTDFVTARQVAISMLKLVEA